MSSLVTTPDRLGTGGAIQEFIICCSFAAFASASARRRASALYMPFHLPAAVAASSASHALASHQEAPAVVLTRQEAQAVLAQMRRVPKLMASLLYGSGLRLLSARGCGSRTWTSAPGTSSFGKARAERIV
jgi:integrase